MSARNERAAHDLLSATDWQRQRAGFATQGPHRRQSRRVGRWLLAFFIVGAAIRAAIGSLS